MNYIMAQKKRYERYSLIHFSNRTNKCYILYNRLSSHTNKVNTKFIKFKKQIQTVNKNLASNSISLRITRNIYSR